MRQIGLLIMFLLAIALLSGCIETCTKEGYCSNSIYQKCHNIGQDKELCKQTQYCVWCETEYLECDPAFENCQQKTGECITVSDVCSK